MWRIFSSRGSDSAPLHGDCTDMKQIVAGIVVCALIGGCSTPSAMLNLADKTSGNVALLNKYIGSFTTNQQTIANERIAISADTAASFAELSARNHANMDAMRLAGMTYQLTLISNIFAASDAEAAIQNQLLLTASNETQILRSSQVQLKTYGTDLTSLSSSLSQLAKDDSLETRVANLVVFAQAVKTNMDSIQAKSTNASQSMTTNAAQFKANSSAVVKGLSSTLSEK